MRVDSAILAVVVAFLLPLRLLSLVARLNSSGSAGDLRRSCTAFAIAAALLSAIFALPRDHVGRTGHCGVPVADAGEDGMGREVRLEIEQLKLQLNRLESFWENNSKASDGKSHGSEEDVELVKVMGLDIQSLIKEQENIKAILVKMHTEWDNNSKASDEKGHVSEEGRSRLVPHPSPRVPTSTPAPPPSAVVAAAAHHSSPPIPSAPRLRVVPQGDTGAHPSAPPQVRPRRPPCRRCRRRGPRWRRAATPKAPGRGGLRQRPSALLGRWQSRSPARGGRGGAPGLRRLLPPPRRSREWCSRPWWPLVVLASGAPVLGGGWRRQPWIWDPAQFRCRMGFGRRRRGGNAELLGLAFCGGGGAVVEVGWRPSALRADAAAGGAVWWKREAWVDQRPVECEHGAERRLALALAGADSDGARGCRLLHEGVVVVLHSPPPCPCSGGKPSIRVSDQTMMTACRHVPPGGIVLGVGLSWRDQWRGGGGVVGALCVVTTLELLRKGRKLSSEDG